MSEISLYPRLGVLKTDTFSRAYPSLNGEILRLPIQTSRNGDTHEILDFKTQLTNPYRRFVGGYGRNINPFFLLAEAVWIFAGRKDVAFLKLFNEKMGDFSDDGVVFHAPYGFRLRHWGVRAEDKYVEENNHASQGFDQVYEAIRLLAANPETRQVVMSIWNPEFDLGVATKDLPCNDMVMLKIRDGKLITTIHNRSNDLHWGLPTNIFQFSFLTECIAACLGVELGTQTHNSQSLHIYTWNETATKMQELYGEAGQVGGDLYDVAQERRMDFNFTTELPTSRLREIDFHFSLFVRNLTDVGRGVRGDEEELCKMRDFSAYLYDAYRLCRLYLEYKADLKIRHREEDKNVLRAECEDTIAGFYGEESAWDAAILAQNFFAARMIGYKHRYLGKL